MAAAEVNARLCNVYDRRRRTVDKRSIFPALFERNFASLARHPWQSVDEEHRGTIRRICDITVNIGRKSVEKERSRTRYCECADLANRREIAVGSRLTPRRLGCANIQWYCQGRRKFLAFDIFGRGSWRLPCEKLDRATKHDYDVSKEHYEQAPLNGAIGGGCASLVFRHQVRRDGAGLHLDWLV